MTKEQSTQSAAGDADPIPELFSRRWQKRIVIAAVFALILKLGLAWFSPGTQDVRTFKSFSDVILSSGGLSLYHKPLAADAAFNYLPFMLRVTQSARFVSDWAHLPFAFCWRLLSIVADVGSALVLWKIVAASDAERKRKISPLAFLLYVGSPVVIWVSGFHGNTDPIMIFFLLLSLLLLQRQQAAWLIGVAFGMSLNIKLMPLIFVPLFLIFLKQPRRRIEYSISVVATVFCAGLPYFLQDTIFVSRRAFGYNGLYEIWGISRLLRLLPSQWQTLDFLFMHGGRFLLLGALLLCTLWMNRLRRKPDLLQQCAVLLLLFLVLTPGFGVQYLAWLAPVILALDLPAAATFYLVSGLYLSFNYTLFWIQYPLGTWPPLPLAQALISTEIACWLSIVVLFLGETRRLARDNQLPQLAELGVSAA